MVGNQEAHNPRVLRLLRLHCFPFGVEFGSEQSLAHVGGEAFMVPVAGPEYLVVLLILSGFGIYVYRRLWRKERKQK